MFDRRHPFGWLFYLLPAVVVSPAQTPPGTTTISEPCISPRTGSFV
jgi:hypothetical protein